MVAEYVIHNRAAKAEETTEKEESEDDPVITISARIMLFRVRVVNNREHEHPDCGGEMAVDAAGLVVDVKKTAKAFEIGMGYWAVASVDVFVVFGPIRLVVYQQ